MPHENESNSAEQQNSDDETPQSIQPDAAQQTEESEPNIGLFQTLLSVFSAVFGIQTKAKHERDFTQGKASNFILAGIIFVIAFITTLFFVVSAIIENAGVS